MAKQNPRDKLQVSQHAVERMCERLGLKNRSVHRIAARALEKGLTREETEGALRQYMEHVFMRSKKANNLRLYGDKVFIFAGSCLITVFLLPKELKPLAKQAWDQKKESNADI